MAKRRHYLTARLPDGYVKTIGPTAQPFTHYWRIVATLANGKSEVFWGHTHSLAEAKRKRAPLVDAARQRGWRHHIFEIVELERSDTPPLLDSLKCGSAQRHSRSESMRRPVDTP